MDFTAIRIPFIVLPSGEVRFQDEPDGRTCWEWASTDLRLDRQTWENAVRGYISSGRVQFFTGADYGIAELDRIPFVVVAIEYERRFGSKPVRYGNGVCSGKEGEFWPPRIDAPYPKA